MGAKSWEKNLMDPYFWIRDAVKTSDGGYITVGVAKPPAAPVMFGLYKLDGSGNLLWSKSYVPPRFDVMEPAFANGLSVAETSDGGFIAAGVCGHYGQLSVDTDPWSIDPASVTSCLLKTDRDGNQQWFKFLVPGIGFAVQTAPDGGFLVAGRNGKAFLVKTDPEGNILWERDYREGGASAIQPVSDGFVLTGISRGDVYLLKTNKEGDVLFEKEFGGRGLDRGFDIQPIRDGLVIAGDTDSSGQGGKDVYLLRTDTRGNLKSARVFGGQADDSAQSVEQTSDGGYILAGWTKSSGAGGKDIYVIRTDPDKPTFPGQIRNTLELKE
jgi:hypothetical protein